MRNRKLYIMSNSPQRNHLKENNSQNSEDYQSTDLLTKIYQLKEHQNLKKEKSSNLVAEDNIENTNSENSSKLASEEMLQQQTQQQTSFEMMKHCGLVDDLNMYDQYDGQQLDSSSASSKTEEMPISSNSPQANVNSHPASPNSDAGSLASTNVNNDVQLNSSHNSISSSGRVSNCLNSLNSKQTNQLNQLNQAANQMPITTSGVNVNILLNNVVSTANSLNDSNVSPTPAITAQQLHQQTNNNNSLTNNNLLSELSALMAAANNQNSNLPNSTNNLSSSNHHTNNNHHSSNGNVNSLAGLNGLNLLNSLTNTSPFNQIATLLAGNSNPNQQQMLLQQATNLGNNPLGKVSLKERISFKKVSLCRYLKLSSSFLHN